MARLNRESIAAEQSDRSSDGEDPRAVYNRKRIALWDGVVERWNPSRGHSCYYHLRLKEIYRNVIPTGSRVLENSSKTDSDRQLYSGLVRLFDVLPRLVHREPASLVPQYCAAANCLYDVSNRYQAGPLHIHGYAFAPGKPEADHNLDPISH